MAAHLPGSPNGFMSPQTDTNFAVAVCDTQPVTAAGLRALLGTAPDFEFRDGVASLDRAASIAVSGSASVIVVDKAFGANNVLDWLQDLKLLDRPPAVVVWGVSMTEAEALRFLQAGARGIIRKSADVSTILTCIRTVASGRSWMEEHVFRDAIRSGQHARSELTAREQQVLELVEQGFKNKEIAQELGIRPGTVKIHLKHIFEKTGVRGRYGLALSGLRDRGVVSLTA